MPLFRKPYFNLIKQFSLAWFKARDQGTILGILWSFLNPLIIALILFFIFRNSLNKGNYFFIYILSGTIIWNFLASSIQSATTVLLWRRELVKNIYFPKETLVYGLVGMFIIQHLFELMILLAFLLIMKLGISIHLIFLPAVFMVECLIILGLGLILALVSVYARDIEYIWAAISRMGLFLVPIFYQVEHLSERLEIVVKINPITQIIIFYRDVLIDHRLPNLTNFAIVLLFAIILFLLSLKIFKKHEKIIAERV